MTQTEQTEHIEALWADVLELEDRLHDISRWLRKRRAAPWREPKRLAGQAERQVTELLETLYALGDAVSAIETPRNANGCPR